MVPLLIRISGSQRHIHWNKKWRTPSCTDCLSHACTSKVEAAFLCSFSHGRTIKEEHRYANCSWRSTRKHVFMCPCQNCCLQVMIGTFSPQVKMVTIRQKKWIKLMYFIRQDYIKLVKLLSYSPCLSPAQSHSPIFPTLLHDLLRPERWCVDIGFWRSSEEDRAWAAGQSCVVPLSMTVFFCFWVSTSWPHLCPVRWRKAITINRHQGFTRRDEHMLLQGHRSPAVRKGDSYNL